MLRRLLLLGLLASLTFIITGSPEPKAIEAALGDTFLVSRPNGSTTTQGTNDSFNASMSSDGRYVVFASLATNLTAVPDTNGVSDIFLRDRTTNLTELISINSTGTAAGCASSPCNVGIDSSSNNPTVSDDGCRVAFLTKAADLAGTIASLIDPNGVNDVYIRDRGGAGCGGGAAVTRLVSKSSATGVACTVGNEPPSISGNGRYVVFRVNESFSGCNIDPAFPSASGAIFRYDFNTNTNQRVSLKNGGSLAATVGDATNPTISTDGCKIAFESTMDLNGAAPAQSQIFVRDECAGPKTTTIVSRSTGVAGAIPTDTGQTNGMISGDGSTVTWHSNSQQIATAEFASNSLTATQSIAITVVAASGGAPVFLSPASATFAKGYQAGHSFNLNGSQNTAVIACNVTAPPALVGACAAQLPTIGLNFNDFGSLNAWVHGTPTPAAPASVSMTLSATNIASGPTIQNFTLNIQAAPPPGGPPVYLSPASVTVANGITGGLFINAAGGSALTHFCGPLPTMTIASGTCGGELTAGVGFTDNGQGRANFIGNHTSSSTLHSRVTNKVVNSWARDLGAGVTHQVNLINGTNAQPDRDGNNPTISTTGQFVMFQSSSTALGGNDARQDTFVRDRTLQRHKDQTKLDEGQTRWLCNACLKHFIVDGDAKPEACPEGHRNDDPELTTPATTDVAE